MTATEPFPRGRLERQLQLLERALATGAVRFRQAEALLAPISSATLTRLLRECCATGLLHKETDGSYRPGPRIGAWQEAAAQDIPAGVVAAIHALGEEQGCTVTMWSVHGRSLRCRFRHLDEHSPGLSSPGNIRPVDLASIGGGLFLPDDGLDDAQLRRQAARTPGRPGLRDLRRILRCCRDHGLYDDNGRFWPGSRRLAVRAGRRHLVALAVTSVRIRHESQRDELVQALRRCAGTVANESDAD